MLSRQWVPCGERVLMLVNWVDGTRAQSFSFLRMSNSELWGEEPKSPSTTTSFSPAEKDLEKMNEILIIYPHAELEDAQDMMICLRSLKFWSLSFWANCVNPPAVSCGVKSGIADLGSKLTDWPLSVSWILGERRWHLTSSVLWFLPLDSPVEAVACMWTFTTVSSYEPT